MGFERTFQIIVAPLPLGTVYLHCCNSYNLLQWYLNITCSFKFPLTAAAAATTTTTTLIMSNILNTSALNSYLYTVIL